MKLVICEKPSVGAAIAAALGVKEKKNGYFENDEYVISWCIGHLVGLAEASIYDEKYKKWNYSDLPIIPDDWKFSLSKDKEDQFKVLKTLMERSDITSLVNACDAGREGELIFRLVVNQAGCNKPLERLWISSMEDSAIIEGFENLKDGREYDSLYESALARQEADWLIGINASRLFSILYGSNLSVGRVQSPTLSMLVERQDKIDHFQKEKYHLLHLSINGADAVSDKYDDEHRAISTLEEIKGKEAICKSVQVEKKTNKPQKLYDLTTLQREANRIFGYTAKQTLEYAQSLYEKKLITYPRTDSRALTSDMEATALSIVQLIKHKEPFSTCHTFEPNIKALINDKGVSDHHAIIPTAEIESYDISLLPKQERYLLNLIMCRMFTACAESFIYEAMTVTLECAGITFTAKGKHTLQEGFKEIEKAFRSQFKSKEADKDEEEKEEQSLPVFAENTSYEPESISMTEHFTSPPKNYTEDTLLSSMEKAGVEDMPEDAERKGLGTPATRAGIIEKLISMGFVERKGKSMLPTDKGKNLISVLPEALTTPLLTAEWEDKLGKIAKKEMSADTFMDEMKEYVRDLVRSNSSAPEDKVSMFSQRTSLGKCPRCGSDVYEGKKSYFCGNRDCSFSLFKENKFWTSRKKELSPKMVEALLDNKGSVFVKGMYSPMKDKKYDATVILDDTGGKYVNFKLEFAQKGGKKK